MVLRREYTSVVSFSRGLLTNERGLYRVVLRRKYTRALTFQNLCLHGKYTRALTFQNLCVCQGRRISPDSGRDPSPISGQISTSTIVCVSGAEDIPRLRSRPQTHKWANIKYELLLLCVCQGRRTSPRLWQLLRLPWAIGSKRSRISPR